MRLIILIILFSNFLLADSVILKNGNIIYNCKIDTITDAEYKLITTFGKISIPTEAISTHIDAPFEFEKNTIFYFSEKNEYVERMIDIKSFSGIIPQVTVSDTIPQVTMKNKVFSENFELEEINKNLGSISDALWVLVTIQVVVIVVFTVMAYIR